MAAEIVRVGWNGPMPGQDLHVLAGKSTRPLTHLLVIKDTVQAKEYLASKMPAGTGITVKFFGEFAGAPASHGVRVFESSGGVAVTNPRPAVALDSFVVRAELTDARGVFTTTPRIRVQVHNRLAVDVLNKPRVWLTPDTLSIHRGSDGQAFSLFAEFDDGIIGDMSQLTDITWELENPADSTKLAVDPDSFGALSGKVDDAVVRVKATLSSDWGGHGASARVRVLPPWGTSTGPRSLDADLVAGDRAAKNDVPNILFLPEGFTDRTQFEKTVTSVVKFLQTDDRTSPFDWLEGSINYWRAFIPSPEAGTSVIHELFCFNRGGGNLFGFPMPRERAPGGGPAQFAGVEELLHHVGPPLPAYALPPGASAQDREDLSKARHQQWKTLHGAALADRSTEALFLEWTAFTDRRLADERDSALGLALGARPSFENPTAMSSLSWNLRRTQRGHLDKLLRELKDPKETSSAAPKIGVTWASGKDRALVVVLAAGAHHGGTRTGPSEELITAALDSPAEIELTAVGRRVQHVPYPIPKTPSLNARMVFAHEFCHALDLGDEYGDVGRLPAGTSVTDLNIQDLASLSSAQGLEGSKLKWLWPRIARAAVLTGPPTGPDGAGRFTIPVTPRQEKAFDSDQPIVQLRTRNLVSHRASDLFRVVDKRAGKLIVKPESTLQNTVALTTFAARDLVIAPVLASGKPLLLVHQVIQDHISQFHQPLNAPRQPTPGRTCDQQKKDDRAIQMATNFPGNLQMPNGLHSKWEAVGVYEGGHGFLCGAYHPTGACVMRQALLDMQRDDDNQRVLRFCPVCRYVLVDQVNPTKHRLLDHWFNRRYPKAP